LLGVLSLRTLFSATMRVEDEDEEREEAEEDEVEDDE
jgi:hypothetical protein